MKKIFFLFFSLFSNRVFSQPNEMLHLHFDKQTYIIGETIYFKAYLFYDNQPSTLSTNFYVAAYTDDGKLWQQKQYPIFEGTCNGDFTLPDTLQSNTIRIRAFTKGLQINDKTSIHEYTVSLLNKKAVSNLQNTTSKINTHFGVEGGNAISSLQNTIAILSTDGNGNAVSTKGTIIENETTEIIDSFFTNEYGLDKLQLVPQINKTYSAVFYNHSNQLQKNILPIKATNGVLLHLEQVNNWLYYNVLKSSTEDKYNSVQLLAEEGLTEIYKASAKFNGSNQWVNKINLDSLPNGILQFSLLDSENSILQKILFLNNNTSNDPFINVQQKNISAKGENIIELQLNDSLLYNLSASLTDINFNLNNSTIKKNIWLTKDILPNEQIVNTIFKTNDNKSINELLLTARTNITDTNEKKITALLDNFLTIQAIYKSKNYAIPKNNNLTLMITDSIVGKQFYKLMPSSQTGFIKDGLIFYDSAQFNYQLDKDKEASEKIILTNYNTFIAAPKINAQLFTVFTPTATASTDTTTNALIDNFVKKQPQEFNKLQILKEVVVKNRYQNPQQKRMEVLDKEYTSGMFSGLSRGVQFNLLDEKNAWSYTSILSYLTYRLPSVKICDGSFLNDAREYGCGKETRILTFLNETELPDQVGIDNIPVSQIAYVKFVSGIVIGSSFTTKNGALYIYTKKDNELDNNLSNTSMCKQKVKGYNITQSFPIPDYTDKKNLLNADTRTTLYWNPYILMNKDQSKFKIVFNNNDISKKLLLIIEGFSENGKLVHIEKIIE